jgi:uncharacterized protein (DUF2236 family)
LLQIAHPAVADGVARYSNFKQDALGRGYRTFRAMATIYFGTVQQADAVSARLQRIHTGIKGDGYVATDQGLQVWVWATLIDTSLVVFGPLEKRLQLPPDWKARFYEESRLAARVLGIEAAMIPPDLAAFDEYMQQMMDETGPLGGQSISAELAQSIVFHKLAPQPLGRLLAIGWLPDWLCLRLDLATSDDDRARFGQKTLPRLYWLLLGLPRGLRYAPAWHQAHCRIARAEGNRPKLWGRFLWWLGRRWQVPLGI